MTNSKEDICKIEVDQLTVRTGITPEGKPSLILSMPSAQEENVYVTLKIDGKEKLLTIVDCIFTTILKQKDEEIRGKKESRTSYWQHLMKLQSLAKRRGNHEKTKSVTVRSS